MRTLYTELFSDFLTDNETTPEWTAIVTKFGTFPAFYIQGVRKSDGTYSNISLSSLYDLFVERYDISSLIFLAFLPVSSRLSSSDSICEICPAYACIPS